MKQLLVKTSFILVICAGARSLAVAQGGAPPQLQLLPVPSANPITEEKRALGKILFWDEQLSGDSTVACGTCHGMGSSGTDGRTGVEMGINPGIDGIYQTADDIRSSFGVAHADVLGHPVQDSVFGFARQVTRRSANAAVISAYSPLLFWDGRAGSAFLNPETGSLSIASGAALENQAIAPILSSVEMGRDDRAWSEVEAKLARSEPLGLATSVPSDVIPLISSHKTYGDLFQAAFGDPAITGERIAFAIATYERTLIPNQTPYDRFAAGAPPGTAGSLTQAQFDAWNKFRGSPCALCHTPPLFTNNTFHNIGMRPPAEDAGRQEITQALQDRGRFKVPTLRGVGLKTTFMHNGGLRTLDDVLVHYAIPRGGAGLFLENLDGALPVPVPQQDRPGLIDFLANGLTDARVRDHTFPFDQPTLQAGNLPQLFFDADKATMRWPALTGVASYVMYRGDLADLVDVDHDGLPDLGYGSCVSTNDPNTADTVFVDSETPAEGRGFFYLKGVVDGATVRGLGVTSTVQQRVPASTCP